MIREQRIGFLFLVGVILIAEVLIHRDVLFYDGENSLSLKEISLKDDHLSEDSMGIFDPNTYTKEDWKGKGFSDKQVEILLKYKDMLGGKFTSKQQLKDCFVISEKKYEELSPFLLLPEKTDFEEPEKIAGRRYLLKPFDPNVYRKEDWKKIGFSDRQADVILNYKKILGGKFTAKEQLRKCYVISEEKYSEIASYILLPEKEKNHQSVQAETNVSVKKDLNSATLQDLVSCTGELSIAKKIINFRRGLGGFVSEEQLKDVYGMTTEVKKVLLDNFVLDNSKVSKINLAYATEGDLQNHIYLRKYKNKVIEAQSMGKDPKQVISQSDSNYDFIMLYLE